jgi:hypothetical protein
MIEGPFTAGCECGAIRFQIDRVFDVIYCHCRACRRRSGAPVLVSLQVPGDAMRLAAGRPTRYRTSKAGVNHFCGTCGCGVFGEYFDPSHPLAVNGRYYSVRLGALDEPERLGPTIHQFVEYRLAWFDTTDALPRFAGNTLPHLENRG